jgi:hypothetical protein
MNNQNILASCGILAFVGFKVNSVYKKMYLIIPLVLYIVTVQKLYTMSRLK